jgi:hypothetical protein
MDKTSSFSIKDVSRVHFDMVKRQMDAAVAQQRDLLEREIFSTLASAIPARRLTPEERFKVWANEMSGCTCSCHDDYYD